MIEAVGPAEAERAVLGIAAVVGTLEDQRQTAPSLEGEVAFCVVHVAGDHVYWVARVGIVDG